MGNTSTRKKKSDIGSWREVRPGVWQVRAMNGFREDGRPRTRSKTIHPTFAAA